MKKMQYLVAAMTMAVSLAAITQSVEAASPYVETISASTTSAPANNSSTITFTITSKRYRCSKQYPSPPAPSPYYVYPSSDTSECNSVTSGYSSTPYNLSPAVLIPNSWNYTISASGSGNTLSATSVKTNASGYATVTLRSSVAGSKTVKLISNVKGSYTVDSVTVNFTAVSSPTSSTPTTSPTQTAPTTNPTTTTKPAPAAPKVDEVMVSGTKVDTAKPITIAQDKPLALSGKTIPNGTVTLTIHSTPRTVTVKADKNGNWTYTVTDLEAGDHYVEAKVTDPTTKKTSAATKLLSFKVAAAATPITTTTFTPAKSSGSSGAIIVIGSVALLAIVATIALYVRKRLHDKRMSGHLPPADMGNPSS